MKLATWNINSLDVRLPQVLDWLAANPVDVLAPAGTQAQPTTSFRCDAFTDRRATTPPWFGQKTYNGVALLSTHAARDVVRNIPGFGDDSRA